MSHPLLEGLDALVGAALRQRLVEARAAALAAAGGDPEHPLVARVREVEAAVVAAMRAGVESLAAALPADASSPAASPAPAPRPPVRCLPAHAAPAARPDAPIIDGRSGAHRPPVGTAGPAAGPGRLAALRRAPAPEPAEPPEPPVRTPPTRPEPRPRLAPPPPPPIDPNDHDIPW